MLKELTEFEWDILNDLLKFLQYFKQASKTVSKDTNFPLPSAVVIFILLSEKIDLINFKLQDKIDKSKNSDGGEYIDKKLLLSFQAGLSINWPSTTKGAIRFTPCV